MDEIMPKGIYKRTPDMKLKIRLAKLGKPLSESHKKSISKSCKGRSSWLKGKHLSEDYKVSISKGCKGRSVWNKNLTKETDERVRNIGRINSELKKGKSAEEILGVEKALIFRQKLRSIKLKQIIESGQWHSIGKHETQLLNEQEIKDNCKILRQYPIYPLNYVLDGYCPSTNTVYEIYEKHHNKQSIQESDKTRQEKIQKYLNCNFVIIWDK